MRVIWIAGVALAAATTLTPAIAGTMTASVPVSLTVTAACSAFSANSLDFGSAPAINSTVTATTTVSVTCANSVPYTVLLSAGLHFCSGCGTRGVADNANDQRAYILYQDANHTTQWGDANATINQPGESGTGNGSAQSLTIYGQTGVISTTPAGSYSDTVTATLSF